MNAWQEGADTIREMITAGDLQLVNATVDDALDMLQVATKHVVSAQTIAEDDPDGAFAMLYDAARKSLAAVLLAQGVRATSKGGHYVVQQAIAAQFTKPPPRDTFRRFGRLRRTRNNIEYGDYASTSEDVEADVESVRSIVSVASQIVPHLGLFRP